MRISRAKLFAWIGGIALFLGVVFFIKFAFEHNLIPPEARAAIGFLVGILLLAGGVIMKRKETEVTAQTLCSTGVLILYGVTFVLPMLGAIGTALMQISWCGKFFETGGYFNGGKVFIAMAIFTGFEFLFLAEVAWEKARKREGSSLSVAMLVLGAVAMFAAFYFLSFSAQGVRPVTLFGYLFVVDLGLLALVILDESVSWVLGAAGMVAFAFLAGWTQGYLDAGNLYSALGFYFVFALFHSAAPVVICHLQKRAPAWWSHLFAPVRYASIGLLGSTLIKLFLHDLSELDQLYRIAAFIVVAAIAILASFLYQRFLLPDEKNDNTIPPPLP